MDNEQQTEAQQQEALYGLYPSMRPLPQIQKVETENDRQFAAAKAEGVATAAMPEAMVGEKMYGFDAGEGAPVADYGPHGLSSFFDQRVIEARGIKDYDEVETLNKTREATNEAFRDYQVGPSRASEIMSLAHRYTSNPGDGSNLEAVNRNVTANLRAEFGSKTDKLLQGAQRVSADLCKRIPNFSNILAAGLGSDEKFVRAMIVAARKKGYV